MKAKMEPLPSIPLSVSVFPCVAASYTSFYFIHPVDSLLTHDQLTLLNICSTIE